MLVGHVHCIQCNVHYCTVTPTPSADVIIIIDLCRQLKQGKVMTEYSLRLEKSHCCIVLFAPHMVQVYTHDPVIHPQQNYVKEL